MQGLKEFSIYTKRLIGVKDAYAITANAAALGMDEHTVDENAGFAVAIAIERRHKRDAVLFVCGPGGKGQIGLSAARHLVYNSNVSVAFVADPGKGAGYREGFEYRSVNDAVGVADIGMDNINELKSMAKKPEVVVDALLGVGMKGRLSSLMINAIEAINKSGKRILSIDVPSGIDADTGNQNLACVKADEALVLHKMKKGVELSKSIGGSVVLDVGIPVSAELLCGPGDVYMATESRMLYSNKYTHGKVMVVGGSKDYTGAPLLSAFGSDNAFAALRSGSGYVTIAVPKGVSQRIQSISEDLIVNEIDIEGDPKGAAARAAQIKHDVTVIGPGLSKSDNVVDFVERLLKSESAKGNAVVVDATAIKVLAKMRINIRKNMVITPHDGEFETLSGMDLKDRSLHERVSRAIEFARIHGCTLVLKGHETIITNGELLKINRARSAALAVMGTGDVLSGIIASYAALHKDLFESSAAAVYVHSAIADRLYEQKGAHIIARDIVDALPEMLKSFDTIA
ncbi:MAG: NAD(P)H-hydrate dehydratase [Candidatus Micrarchaeota archaeon]|nr:NAD(P)H-hydrate dehydratase [Candidatus Micrarchaeota archaeon]